MALTKEQLEAIEIGDWERSIEARNRKLQAQRDAAESLRQKHEVFAEKMRAERDEAREMYRALSKLIFDTYYNTPGILLAWAYDGPETALANITRVLQSNRDERDEAKRHLRQLLHALDVEKDGAGKQPPYSHNVRFAMIEARRYLQARAGREE